MNSQSFVDDGVRSFGEDFADLEASAIDQQGLVDLEDELVVGGKDSAAAVDALERVRERRRLCAEPFVFGDHGELFTLRRRRSSRGRGGRR